jgi:hypothetical protein
MADDYWSRYYPVRPFPTAGNYSLRQVIAVLNMYQNPVLTFVSRLILLKWAIVCLQEVREFSLWDIIVKSVFMLSRSLKCLHDLKV